MRLLFIDDEKAFTDLVLAELPRTWNKYAAYNLKEARGILALNDIDVVVLDLKLPDGDGMSLLRELRSRGEGPEVFILTGHGSVVEAVEAMRLGVFDFITKPVTIDHLETVIKAAGMRKGVPDRPGGSTASGIDTSLSPGLRKLGWQALEILRNDIPLLIYGEPGVGKRRLAQTVHEFSAPDTPCFVVDCTKPDSFREVLSSVMNEDLSQHASANGKAAVIFHEIAFLSMEDQSTLLDMLAGPLTSSYSPEKASTRAMANRPLIATTSEVLQNKIEDREFREDLFFRISGFTLTVPPLRDRADDAITICQEVLPEKRLASPARQALLHHSWPGNVDELMFTLRLAADAAHESEVIRKSHIDAAFSAAGDYYRPTLTGPLSLRDVEYAHIHRILRYTSGNQTHAARLLGIDPKTLYRKLRAENAPEGDKEPMH